MIEYKKGNIFEDDSEAIINTVNLVGVMGKGIALQFKKAYPENFKAYVQACKTKQIDIGKNFTFISNDLLHKKIIINFPTKKDWRHPSKYEYLEKGLDDLIEVIQKNEVKSIAIPPLGSGNGGLMWQEVKKLIELKLNELSKTVKITVYEPNQEVQFQMDKEKVKLTNARALLLKMLYFVDRNWFISPSEFVAVKLVYFMQKFGGKDIFRCDFIPYYYGPYNDKIRHVLTSLTGSYIKLFNHSSHNPFIEFQLDLNEEDLKVINDTISNNPNLKKIEEQTLSFLVDFQDESSFELLSSVDFILNEKEVAKNLDSVIHSLNGWNERKKKLATNRHAIEVTYQHIINFNTVMS